MGDSVILTKPPEENKKIEGRTFVFCFVLFFSFSQDCFGNLRSFVVPYKFRIICSNSGKNVMSVL